MLTSATSPLCALSYPGSIRQMFKGEMESCERAPGDGCAVGEHACLHIWIQGWFPIPVSPALMLMMR